MSVYSYSARKATGESVAGEMTARSVDDLRTQLMETGVLLSRATLKSRSWGGLRAGRPVRLRALLAFLHEYRSLAAAALPLPQILSLLAKRKDDARLAAAISGVRERVETGKSLADAMADFPNVFDALFQATFRVGAQTGNLDGALDQLEKFVAMRHDLQRQVRKAMAYPIFLLILLFVVLSGLMLFVLPRFATLYSEFDAELPLATRILMGGVEYAPVWVPVSVTAFVGLWALGRLWGGSRRVRLAIDRLKIRLPIAGGVFKNIINVQICHMMSLLLRSGVPLPEALGLTAAGIGNTQISAKLVLVQRDIGRGKSLSETLEKSSIFPETSLSLLQAGEVAGELERMFSAVSVMHEQQLEDQMNLLLALIEPVMMLLVGVVLGTVIIAVYLPIFGLSAVVQ